ncbi:MAG: hypothetical protein KH231_06020 [Dialister sp.]|uniref:hypothetical protein n=1 Tax=Dialister sp. TaxID=1955814 RepID=UPI001DAAC71F|nr:hypothetical protein [Dialister sp.]MBS6715013.1 hypothetical protein [Dialister sp.]
MLDFIILIGAIFGGCAVWELIDERKARRKAKHAKQRAERHALFFENARQTEFETEKSA